jgi:unsaturated rhamnogalacturonyl hydrolase
MAIFITLLFIIILLIDVIPQFNTWQSRIKIGQFTSKDDWKIKVSTLSKKWLFKTPTIKLTDNSRLIIIDILKGNYKRNAIQHWQEASLLLGIIEEYKTTKQESSKVIINTFLESKLNENGTWKNAPKEIDGVILAYALLSIPFIDLQKYKPAFDKIYQLILDLKGSDGTIAYKKHSKNYRYVDTIGFICPFLTTYGLKYNQNEAIDLVVLQITEYNKYGLLNDTFIPCHTYTIETKLPVGLFGWARGLGWYAIGLIDSWKALPESDSRKKELEQSVIQFAKMALHYQEKNGAWHWLISNTSSQFDSSATATLAWFLNNAATISAIQNECSAASANAMNYLMKVTQRNGAVDFSQGDTKGIAIHSQEFDILPFTQGFVLRNLYL